MLKNEEKVLNYSDKVKNYRGKNIETNIEKLNSKYYDEHGKRKVFCDDEEKIFSGEKNALLISDAKYIEELIRLFFAGCELSEEVIKDKVQRIMDAKIVQGKVCIDIRYFFKNDKYLILPFHITKDRRSRMLLYYCQTRAKKCFLLPKTKYSLTSTQNYLAYFPIESFDEMCFISFLFVKSPMMKGMDIYGFDNCSSLLNHKVNHDKDFVYEYIYQMIIDKRCAFFPLANAYAETLARVFKYPGFPDASEWHSLYAEINAEMVEQKLTQYDKKDANERKLFFIVKEIYPDAIYQFRDEWLGIYSLDIYIPSIKTAVEYQGEQHYKSVEFFGGANTFKSIQERDSDKKELCFKKGIRLIEWNFKVPVSIENARRMLK